MFFFQIYFWVVRCKKSSPTYFNAWSLHPTQPSQLRCSKNISHLGTGISWRWDIRHLVTGVSRRKLAWRHCQMPAILLLILFSHNLCFPSHSKVTFEHHILLNEIGGRILYGFYMGAALLYTRRARHDRKAYYLHVISCFPTLLAFFPAFEHYFYRQNIGSIGLNALPEDTPTPVPARTTFSPGGVDVGIQASCSARENSVVRDSRFPAPKYSRTSLYITGHLPNLDTSRNQEIKQASHHTFQQSTRVPSIAYIREPIAREHHSLSWTLHTYPSSGVSNLLVICVATGLACSMPKSRRTLSTYPRCPRNSARCGRSRLGQSIPPAFLCATLIKLKLEFSSWSCLLLRLRYLAGFLCRIYRSYDILTASSSSRIQTRLLSALVIIISPGWLILHIPQVAFFLSSFPIIP